VTIKKNIKEKTEGIEDLKKEEAVVVRAQKRLGRAQ
jgi:hypothetical protein